MRWLLVVLGLAGCDKLLGLSDVHVGESPPPDAPMTTVTGRYELTGVSVDSTFMPSAVTRLAGPSDIAASASLLDGTALPTRLADDGTIAIDVPLGDRYALVVQRTIEAGPTEIQTGVSTFMLHGFDYDRPDATFATQPTPISLSMSGLPAQKDPSATIFLASTGIRLFSVPDSGSATVNSATANLDWSRTGRGLLSATKHDRLYVERFQTLGFYARMTDYAVADVEMQDGVSNSILANAAQVPTSYCFHLSTNRLTDTTALQTLTHAQPAAMQSGWQLSSIASPQMWPDGRLLLASGSEYSSGAGDELDVAYGTPYTGEAEIIDVDEAHVHSIRLLTAALPLDLADTVLQTSLVPRAASCNQTISPDALQIAIMSSVSVGGQLLANDNQVVSVDRSQPIPIDYTMTAGASDYVLVQLAEVVSIGVAPNTQTQIIGVAGYVGTSPIVVDPRLLAKGRFYVLVVGNYVGFPNASIVDFHEFTFPTGVTQRWTPMFQIAD